MMALHNLPEPYKTSDPASFAFTTARLRWPVIITGAIDDLYRSAAECDEGPKKDEGKRIIENIARLKHELQHNRPMTPIQHDGGPDVDFYNFELSRLGNPSWMDCCWLYAECYLYRRIYTSFSLSTHWRSYDVFARQKLRAFHSSRSAVLELAARYSALIPSTAPTSALSPEDEDKLRLVFLEMSEICLWGNATDLSLLIGLAYDDIQNLQSARARDASEANILVNDLRRAFDILRRAATDPTKAGEERRIDIVLDNAGFELYVDLVLVGFLVASGLATRVVLHSKSMPWFVSDVVPADFTALRRAIGDPRTFFDGQNGDETETLMGDSPATTLREEEVTSLAYLSSHWEGLVSEGKLELRPNPIWTGPGGYAKMREDGGELGIELWEELRRSELVIFKGDLNYRKLTGDLQWDPTTPFTTAIGAMGPSSGINVLALRTCKADVVVGLEQGVDETLRWTGGGKEQDGERAWACSGKWAVVSLSEGK